MSKESTGCLANSVSSEDEGPSVDVESERRKTRHKDWSLPRRGKSKIATVKPVSKFMTSSEEDLSSVLSDGENKARRGSLDRASPRITRLLSQKDVSNMGKDALILELEKCLNELETEQICNDSLEDDYLKIEEERNELMDELENAFSDLREYTNRVKKADEEKKTLEADRDELTKECEHLKYVLTHRDEIESQQFGWRKEKNKLETQISELESKNAEYKLELESLYDERQGLITSLLNLNSVEVNEVIKTRSRTSSVVSTDSVASFGRLKGENEELTKFLLEAEEAEQNTMQKFVECKRKMNELEEENDDLRDRMEMLESTNGTLETEREILERTINQLQTQLDKNIVNEELEVKEEHMVALQDKLDCLTEELASVKKELSETNLLVDDLNKKNEDLNSENAKLKNDVRQSEVRQRDSLKELQDERKYNKEKGEQIEMENELLRGNLKTLKADYDRERKEVQKLASTIEKLQDTNFDLTKENQENKEQLKEFQKLQKLDKDNKATIKILEKKKNELEHELQKVKEEKSDVIGNLDKANQRIGAICDDLERAHKEKQRLRESVETHENDKDDMIRRQQKLEREVETLKSENEVLRDNDRSLSEERMSELEVEFQGKFDKLYLEREELSVQLKDLHKAKEDDSSLIQSLETENANLKAKLKVLEKEKVSYALLLREKSSLEKYVDNLKAESARTGKKYEAELSELKERLAHFEEVHVSSSRLKKEKEALETSVENLKNDNNKLREQLKRQRLSSSSAQELTINRLKNENEAVEHRAEVLQDALNKANSENKGLLERLNKADETTASTIRSLKARKNELQMQCSKLQHEKEDNEREIKKLRDHIENIERTGDGYDRRKSESEAAVDELAMQLRSREEELMNAHSKIAELELDNREHTRKLQASEILVLDLQNALARANDLAMEKALEVSRGKRTFEKRIDQISKENCDLKRKLNDSQVVSPIEKSGNHSRALSEPDKGMFSSTPQLNTTNNHSRIEDALLTQKRLTEDERSRGWHSSPNIDDKNRTVNGHLGTNERKDCQRTSSHLSDASRETNSSEICFTRQNSLPLVQREGQETATVKANSSFGATFGLLQAGRKISKEIGQQGEEPPQKPPPPLLYDSRGKTSPKLHKRIQLKQIPFPRLSPTQKSKEDERTRMEHWV